MRSSPDIQGSCGGNDVRGVDGVDERHVHRLLGPPHVGREGDEQRHQREAGGEHRLGAEPQAPPQRVGRRQDARLQARAPPAPEARARRAALLERARQLALAQRDEDAGDPDRHEHADHERGRVRHAEAGRHPHQPRDQQDPERLGEPEPRPRQPPERQPRERHGGKADRLDQREEGRAPRASLAAEAIRRAGGSGGAPSRLTGMSTYERVADLPLTIDDYALEGLNRQVFSGFDRHTTVIRLRGGGEEGLGEDVTYTAEDHERQQELGPVLPLAGEWTFDSFSRHLAEVDTFPAQAPEREVFRNYRHWGFESAALDLALRQAGTSLADAVGREPRPVTLRGVLPHGRPADARPGDAPARRLPGPALQARRHPRLERRADRRAGRDRRGRLDRLQGRLQGHGRRRGDRPGALPPRRRGVPGRLAGGSRPRAAGGDGGARAARGPHHLGRADPLDRRHPRQPGDPARR